jgi:predicted MPP superfamily phosphohydrolase
MKTYYLIPILLIILILVDVYFFQAVTVILRGSSQFKKNIVSNIYISFCVLTYLIFVVITLIGHQNLNKFIRQYVFAILIIVLISKLVGIVFLLMEDLSRLFRFIYFKLFSKTNEQNIGRLNFVSTLAVLLAAIPFSSLILGMIKGAYDYQVKKIKLVLNDLPEEFEGLKIVQISDLHVGSFTETHHLNSAFDLIIKQSPDIIFFTGDLVNDRASETIGYEEIFKKLKAPLGVFSTLGNHDYGDYVRPEDWGSPEKKKENLENLKQVHKNAGWQLLMNENHIINRNDKKLAIIGIENWGANLRFPKYGKMHDAIIGAEEADVKLLLSHDPSHWEAQVLKEYNTIDVMFSGHTHGMQFGIEIPGFKWSPVQYFYKQWAGLYKINQQQLYVNRGLGFIGYPGRVGILPEITVFTLSKI